MSKRMIVPLLFGLTGVAILLWLGFWQLERLDWKNETLAGINARIGAAPADIPVNPDPKTDAYLPVKATGKLGEGVRVLASTRDDGPGYRIVQVLVMENGRRVLLDQGFRRVATKAAPDQSVNVSVSGNLHWPDEVDGWTPEPELENNLWFARDVPALAVALETEPVLIVARQITPHAAGIRPMPVNSSGIPNKHFEYAVTWFLMAIAWAGMTAYLLWRIRLKLD